MRYNFDPSNNLPPDFNEKRYYPDLIEHRGGGGIPIKRNKEMTDAEREAEAEAFKYIDEYDKRSRGQQFQ